jgi:L-iditol 2-dehydrogenase
MKAAELVGPGMIAIIERPDPWPVCDGKVLLAVRMVGICGSDVHYFETGRIGDAQVCYPFVLGHEFAAEVLAVGPGVDQPKVGDIVAVDPAMPCHACDQCNSGRFNTCRNLRFLGCPGQAEGCLCELILMPSECCYRVPRSFSLEQIVLTEPLAIAVHATRLAGLEPGMDIAIPGAGPIGLCCLQVARAIGARCCLVAEPIEQRALAARNHGADWAGSPAELGNAVASLAPGGVHVVLEAAGQQEAIDRGLQVLRPGGVLGIIGIPRTDRIWIDAHKARRQEVRIVNVRRQNLCTQQAIDMIQQGTVEVDFMATHRFSLEQSQDAFELVAGYRHGVIKAMVCI